MKAIFLLSFEFLSYIVVGLLLGMWLDNKWSLGGWGWFLGIFIVYVVWFVQLYKKIKK